MNIIKRQLKGCLSGITQGFRRAHIFTKEYVSDSPIVLEYVILPTGAESTPHAHLDTHTVVFTIQGGVTIYYGDKLEHELIVGHQDSVYIPPGVIHHVVNPHEQDMIAVVARTASSNGVAEHPELLNCLASKVSAL